MLPTLTPVCAAVVTAFEVKTESPGDPPRLNVPLPSCSCPCQRPRSIAAVPLMPAGPGRLNPSPCPGRHLKHRTSAPLTAGIARGVPDRQPKWCDGRVSEKITPLVERHNQVPSRW